MGRKLVLVSENFVTQALEHGVARAVIDGDDAAPSDVRIVDVRWKPRKAAIAITLESSHWPATPASKPLPVWVPKFRKPLIEVAE